MSRESPNYQVNELSIIIDQPAGSGSPDELDSLLARGANPNTQPEKAAELLSQVKPGWASRDPPPQFERWGARWQPPLYCASQRVSCDQVPMDEGTKMTTSLLRYRADPFLEFPQALYHSPRHTRPRAPFPGEDPFRRPEVQIPNGMNFIEWAGHPDYYNSDEDLEEEETPPQWGARHVFHAVIEDGGSLRPFLDYPGFLQSLDVEHRDPQGRTLLLSACRSALGADACVDGVFTYASWKRDDPGDKNNPYPNRARDGDSAQSDDADPKTETFVDILLRLGADPLAVDDQGKNALHHLLVEVSSNQNIWFRRLTVVRRTLRSFVSKHPSLVNQPDQHGLYPLHAALRRMRLHPQRNMHIDMAEPEGCVREMLEAGADARAKDRKGNTALHYLADNDITSIWSGTAQREIFYDLLDKYKCIEDINLPNHASKTVVELILDDNGHMETDKEMWHGLCHEATETGLDVREWKDVDEEVFNKLDKAGVDWKVKPSDGGTLLHLVAQSGLGEDNLIWRFQFLLQKGLDLKATDRRGRTAREVAIEGKLNKDDFYQALEEFEKDKAWV
ncbi:ankyrin repeat-containing domain protein [Thelonectria olida]|uniref:Ankyrin repeat-containing domain protein n=1 Tax=Thelonectria olida TaxID=1576542 RepID=A0A9P9AGV2_9HYPO|nr:ankyrin repeat-containing domain protein [Thelonectria olida]